MKGRVTFIVVVLFIASAQVGALFGHDLSLAHCAKDGGDNRCSSNENEGGAPSFKDAEKTYLSYYEDFGNLDRAIDKLNRILELNPNDVEAMVLFSRVWLTYGDVVAKNRDEKLRAYEKGMGIAKRAIELSPKNPDAHFWYTANMGRWGQTRGVLKSLFLVSQVKEQLNLILALDPNYVPALEVYGVLYYKLPGFLGGNLDLSEKYIRQAIGIDPHLTVARVDLARVLIKRKKYDEARIELDGVLEEKEPKLYADWYVKDRRDAAELMADIKGKKISTRHATPYHSP
jgi:tetratricopeptide (TPR) repeat protein